ncbi:hypothetical protein [Solimonas marina]|uniref:Uncharacterized protein n=1 Tax=Solimonas marina TaxID=2714601 RepID=A0A969WED4_9GAMM|nr:hypothetical protein [Solimonas marina]NKF24565.1 hypothetical protein [Solimonas marina]
MNARLRQQLFDHAEALATQLRYEELSIARLCELGGVLPNVFCAEFPDVLSYLSALQQHFLGEIRSRVIKVTDGAPLGLLRIRLASESYLAYCHEHMHVRDWLVAARRHPQIERGLQQQNHSYALVLGSEFEAIGRTDTFSAAHLYVGMLNEVANREHRARAKQPALREALWHFLEHVGTADAPASPQRQRS